MIRIRIDKFILQTELATIPATGWVHSSNLKLWEQHQADHLQNMISYRRPLTQSDTKRLALSSEQDRRYCEMHLKASGTSAAFSPVVSMLAAKSE